MSFRGIFGGFGLTTALFACNALTGVGDLSAGDGAAIDLPGDRADGAGPADGGAANDGTPVTTTDGSTDASDATGNDARGPFCSTVPNAAFCTDFDEASPTSGWGKSTTNGATAEVTSTNALSAPHAVRAASGSNAANRVAFYSRPLATGEVGHARLSYALYIDERPSFAEIEINGVVFESASAVSEIYLAVDASGASVAEQITPNGGSTASTYFPIGTAIPTKQWVRVTLDVSLGSTRTLLVKVDGQEVTKKALTMALPGTPTIRAGLTWASKDTSSAVVLVDDVAFEVLP